MGTLQLILGLLCGMSGGFFLLFMASFSALTGFDRASALYTIAGLTLLVIAYGLGIGPGLLLIWLIINLFALLAFYVLTLPDIRSLPEATISVDGIRTIDDAAKACWESKLEGWELVAYTQNLVTNKFTYSRRNPWDSAYKAFERGQGYCQQQALALKAIYDRLGIDSRLVYANHCRFPPPANANESLALALDNRWLKAWFRGQENVFGHTWLRVRVGEKELDTCPGNVDNQPGVIDFEPLSEVKTLPHWMQPLTHLGSAIGNLMLERQARRLSLQEA
jgi:hypothetical protein